jgi:hypothetical protein
MERNMTKIAIEDPQKAVSFLEAVQLPTPPSEFEGMVGSGMLPPTDYGAADDHAVAIGSQVAEFAANVPAELRPQIANSFLLAQLAANREIQDHGGGTKAWYDRYIDVLANIGWLVESSEQTVREVSGSALEVHEEIIPVLTAALGPAVAATAVMMSVLNGLAEMNKDQPWITLFDRESQRASANQFQFSYAAFDQNVGPKISLVCFELDASQALTQVLFFKFSSSSARFRHFGAELAMNRAVFDRAKTVVENRIAEYVSSYVADIEI